MSMSTNTHRQFKNVLHVYSCTDTGFNNLTWNKCVKLDYNMITSYIMYYVIDGQYIYASMQSQVIQLIRYMYLIYTNDVVSFIVYKDNSLLTSG